MEDWVRCGICQGGYTEPRQLGCGHSFCWECLLGTQSLYSVTCPVCRKATFLARPGLMGLQGLPPNYALLDALDALRSRAQDPASPNQDAGDKEAKTKACCTAPPASFACLDCQAAEICASCVVLDHRAHQVLSPEQLVHKWAALCRLHDAQINGIISTGNRGDTAAKEAAGEEATSKDPVSQAQARQRLLQDRLRKLSFQAEQLRWQAPELANIKTMAALVEEAGEVAKALEPLGAFLKAPQDRSWESAGAMELSPILQSPAMSGTGGTKLVAVTGTFPSAASVALAGSFNGWAPLEMAPLRGADWVLTLALPTGRHSLKFFVDGLWLHDPRLDTSPDGFGGLNNALDVAL